METTTIDRSKGQWFVLHTMSGREYKAREKIAHQIALADADIPIYEVLIPMEKISEVKNGKKTIHERKIFPGYIYVRMDLYRADGTLNEPVWYFLDRANLPEVISIVGGEKPQSLSPSEVDELIRQTEVVADKDVAQTKVPAYITIGGTVRIIYGAFVNFEGSIEEIDVERGKLKLMVSIFGRSTPVELEFWQVGPDEE